MGWLLLVGVFVYHRSSNSCVGVPLRGGGEGSWETVANFQCGRG